MAFQAHKTDAKLGAEIEKHLKSIGANTPMSGQFATSYGELTRNTQISEIEVAFSDIMKTLGLDLTDDSLRDTPKRYAKMFVNELFWGLRPENFPKVTTVDNKMGYSSMIVERGITVMSACEHHFVTIDGQATVAYIPNGKVLGLSKMNRIVEYFARRPQIQERLTDQIYHALVYILQTEDVAVYIEAEHYCVKSRGVEDHGSSTITSNLGGAFLNNATTRSEFMSMATQKKN